MGFVGHNFPPCELKNSLRGSEGLRNSKSLKTNMEPNTLPETNIAPENRPLEKEIPIGNHHFQGLC